MANRVKAIKAKAETLRALQKAIHAAFAQRDRSKADWQTWQQAADQMRQQYGELAHPTDGSLSAFERGDVEGIEAVIDFLDADPMFFRSGYMKEWMWKRLARFSLSEEQTARLETIALAYTDRRVCREFWYMCRAMVRLASPAFWQRLQALVECEKGNLQGDRAFYLAAYANGIDTGETLHRNVKKESRQRRKCSGRSKGRAF